MTKSIRVLIVDDHPLLRNALVAAINITPDMEVVAEASTGLDAMALVPAHNPDVILMDLMMPKMDGLEAIATLCSMIPHPHILVLSSSSDEAKILKVVSSGALGYISKNAHRDEIIKAIRSVAMGEFYLPPNITARLVNQVRHPAGQDQENERPIESLSAREQEIFGLMGQGISNQKIAETLYISESTVRVHLRNIIIKRGYHDRHEALVAAVEENVSQG